MACILLPRLLVQGCCPSLRLWPSAHPVAAMVYSRPLVAALFGTPTPRFHSILPPSSQIGQAGPPVDAPKISFSTTSVTGSEYNDLATLTVQLSAAATVPVTVDYAAVAGSATASDYVLAPGTLTFAIGETSKVGSVGIGCRGTGERAPCCRRRGTQVKEGPNTERVLFFAAQQLVLCCPTAMHDVHYGAAFVPST